MTEQRISTGRLLLNGVGSFGIAILCLPLGAAGIMGLATAPFGTDPDGADKVLGIELFCGFVGAIALLSLVRTVQAWRRSRR